MENPPREDKAKEEVQPTQPEDSFPELTQEQIVC
jgi:hypothetical protein